MSQKRKSKSTPAKPPSSHARLPSMTEEETMAALRDLRQAHVDSFNFIFQKDGGLDMAVANLNPVGLSADPERGLPALRWWLEGASVSKPNKEGLDEKDNRLFPSECRERSISYTGPLAVNFAYSVDGGPTQVLVKRIGNIPIMVKSNRCYLDHATPQDMIRAKEEKHEQGGFFVMNGNERIIRLLIVNRRNYVMALCRSSFGTRGKHYTKFGTSIRCARPDQTTKTVWVHYLANGAANLRFSYRKQEFFIPVVLLLRSFVQVTDRQIFEDLVGGEYNNGFLTDRAEALLREGLVGLPELRTQHDVYSYLGNCFRVAIRQDEEMSSDEAIGRYVLEDNVFVHCKTGQEKYDLLIFMVRKLYALVEGRIKEDNPDALHTQEILLPGHLYLMILKEKLQDWLRGIKYTILRELKSDKVKSGKKPIQPTKEAWWRSIMDVQKDIGQDMGNFVKTGNLTSETGLDLMQRTGFTIVADKINYLRYLSHFRSVHRGQFFAQMKTTTVRKLLPESWGFMCPVHTPDGAPCGLLNHLAALCHVITHPNNTSVAKFVSVLISLGMTPSNLPHPLDGVVVLLDGIVVGYIPKHKTVQFCKELRTLKVAPHPDVPETVEIVCVPNFSDGIFPGVILSTGPGRMTRPVEHMQAGKAHGPVEWISPMEQVFMEIACTDADIRPGETTHRELGPTAMLSALASLTPFSDFNQSPRNMYQCQMAKQTMGTPFHSFPYRVDNKVYRLQNPQRPVVRNENHDLFRVDDYPLGTNACVAVISYTGYDMEDAMILNKGAFERGFGHASVYKYKKVDLSEKKMRGEPTHHFFSNMKKKGDKTFVESLPKDGLPEIGNSVDEGEPLYAVYDDVRNKITAANNKDPETVIIDEVRAIGKDTHNDCLQQVGLKLRLNRNPQIGDKFSSRHGQKGVLSMLWPQEDMPFTETGITPDVIINPHAFPSRMTIGMLVESMAGKAGCCRAEFQDATPFQFTEKQTAFEYFGQQLLQAGYNYYGTEPMYSGVEGVEMKVEIFFGVVYYQRLRHMVSDKSQVRATGPINSLTHQPIQGRKVHGGIRFGEMERDSLLAHGTSYFLNDRLLLCSDYHTTWVCTQCGNLLAAAPLNSSSYTSKVFAQSTKVVCRLCNSSAHCHTIAVPFVLMYLANELAAMNMKLTLALK